MGFLGFRFVDSPGGGGVIAVTLVDFEFLCNNELLVDLVRLEERVSGVVDGGASGAIDGLDTTWLPSAITGELRSGTS